MKILNLGCGSKASSYPGVINIDWSIMLRIRTHPVLRSIAPLLLNGDRLRRFRALPGNLLVHDLSHGIPFPDASADVVYHSHVLEHLDREVAGQFLAECGRVLCPGGVIRIVVPDIERCCHDYLSHVQVCERDGAPAIAEHDRYLEPILLQSVRRDAYGTSQQKPLRRSIENLLLGDARERGETHQWMYDRFNLTALLLSSGFVEPVVQSFALSAIPNWDKIGLDLNENGKEYKPGSLYMEATRSLPSRFQGQGE